MHLKFKLSLTVMHAFMEGLSETVFPFPFSRRSLIAKRLSNSIHDKKEAFGTCSVGDELGSGFEKWLFRTICDNTCLYTNRETVPKLTKSVLSP